MAYNFKQDFFTPKKPNKVINYPKKKIFYRSSWELHFFEFLDNNPNVIRWGSEVIAIPYIKPTDGKVHRYFPDIYVEYYDKNKNLIKEMVEIKPKKQINLPRYKNRNRMLVESITLSINKAKWEAAAKWCRERGISFKLASEKSIFK